MPSPVTRAQFKAVIPDPSNTICYSFKQALLKLPLLLWQHIGWEIDESGNPTDEFKEDINYVETGFIQMCGNTTIPSGWLPCIGTAISRTDYADLFAAIGTNFGIGNGTTTFNIPDLRGRFPQGDGGAYSVGDNGGVSNVTLLEANIPAHTHGLSTLGLGEVDGHSQTASEGVIYATVGAAGAVTNVTDSYGQATPTQVSIRNPYMTVKFIIKT